MEKNKIKQLKFHEKCISRKQSRILFMSGIPRFTSILEYLYADLWGPATLNTLNEFILYLLIVDNFQERSLLFVKS